MYFRALKYKLRNNTTQGKENFKRTKLGKHQEAILTHQRRWTPKKRYESDFHGQCYSCNEYGHKDLECRSYARRNNGIFHNTIRCWRCDQVGHIFVHFHSMRCYNCSGFGHKSQDCWNTRRNSIMRNSYSMTRRRTEVKKGNIFENVESLSSSSEKWGLLQKWVNNTEQLEKNGILKGSSSVSSIEAYTGDSGNNHIHMQYNLE
jgi:hypothetical protein